MECVLFSIKPQYVNLIFDGIKIYEYRKNKIKDNVNTLIIYCTYPVKKVVGQATIERIIQGSPEYVWFETFRSGGVDRFFFDKYYAGSDKAFAYRLIDIVQYNTPLSLLDFGLRNAPQSYRYINLPNIRI